MKRPRNPSGLLRYEHFINFITDRCLIHNGVNNFIISYSHVRPGQDISTREKSSQSLT